MEVDIHLNKCNRSTLIKLSRRLFNNFKHIKIVKRTIILKKRWYSLEKTCIPVVDLVLLHIPHAINERHREYNVEAVFEESINLHSAVEYFGVKSIGENIIDFLKYQLDDLELSVDLNEEFDPDPILLEEKEDIYVEETYATKKIFTDSITYFYNSITEIICDLKPRLEIVYISTESACNSPPIRAPNIALSA